MVGLHDAQLYIPSFSSQTFIFVGNADSKSTFQVPSKLLCASDAPVIARIASSLATSTMFIIFPGGGANQKPPCLKFCGSPSEISNDYLFSRIYLPGETRPLPKYEVATGSDWCRISIGFIAAPASAGRVVFHCPG